MPLNDILHQPISELARRIENREISVAELTDAFLNRIDKINNDLNIYITIDRQGARKSAASADKDLAAGRYQGKLHGIPYTCKDLFYTSGLPTTGGSKVLEEWLPEHDAETVDRLNRAGSILLGKANLHEFAYGATGENPHFGTTFNPLDPTRLAGGSSSGSAAAVASGTATFALGTDTGGSVRSPAALCGVVGFKPTRGLISTHGVIPYCWSLDHVGIFSRSVGDAAIILSTLTGNGTCGLPSVPVHEIRQTDRSDACLKDTRIGVPRNFFFDNVDSEIETAVRGIIEHCRRSGATITDVSTPDMSHTRTVSLTIQLPEMLSYHSRYLEDKKALYGEDLRAGMAAGQFILAEHYVRAKRMVANYRGQMDDLFRDVDLLITPTCPIVAPKAGTVNITSGNRSEAVGNALTRFTSFFNMTGHPALTIPSGTHSTGLPMGVQLIGRPFEEDALLKRAAAVEADLSK